MVVHSADKKIFLNKRRESMLAIGLGIAAAGIGFVGIGLGYFFGKLLEGIARNPGALADMRGWIFIGFALIETIAIYIFILIFFIPFLVGE
jgi:F-type H+-transporting ATPase subunit c